LADLYPALRPLLFRLDAETAHHLTLGLLRFFGGSAAGRSVLRRLFAPGTEDRAVECLGLRFPNRLGLAAGYDKDAEALAGLACLGFGHLEVGTVTREPQRGNPRPRIFRLPEDKALINRMGFPSRGATTVADRLARRWPAGVVLGVNLGKGVNTPLEEAAEDYGFLAERFRPLADYLTVNVSSPNTLGLRRLQSRHFLEALLVRVRRSLDEGPGPRPPLLVKLAPDLEPAELEDALGACLGKVAGIIATNTTTGRAGLRSGRAAESGGLSGRPLFDRALEQVRHIARWSQGRFVVVGSGGVSDRSGMQAMLDAGATLVQIYTALVFQGPGVVARLISAG
jgi:dihydroorotate dehydrogenase